MEAPLGASTLRNISWNGRDQDARLRRLENKRKSQSLLEKVGSSENNSENAGDQTNIRAACVSGKRDTLIEPKAVEPKAVEPKYVNLGKSLNEAVNEHEPAARALATLKAMELFIPWESLHTLDACAAKKSLKQTEGYVETLDQELKKAKEALSKLELKQKEVKFDMVVAQQSLGGKKAARALLPPWEHDHARSSCALCSEKFSLLNRRHHCRSCGLLVDAKCSQQKKDLPQLGYSSRVRVCDTCFPLPLNGTCPSGEAVPEPTANRSRRFSVQTPLMNEIKQQSLQTRIRASSLNTPVRLAPRNFLAELSKEGVQSRLRSTSSATRPQASKLNAEGREAEGEETKQDEKKQEKPRTVLDELRSSLRKRNSSIEVQQARRESVEEVVARNTNERLQRIASEKLLCMQPKKGTAIAELLKIRAREEETKSVVEDDSEEESSDEEWY